MPPLATTSPQDADDATQGMGSTMRLGRFVVGRVGAGGAGWMVLKPQWRTWAHGADKTEYYKKLVTEQDPALIDVIVDVMHDDDQSDGVRLTLADILLKKNRL